MTDSHTWVSTTFGAPGAAITRATGGRETMPRTVLPAGMHFQNTRLRNNTRVPNPGTLNVLEGGASVTLLGAARAPFELVFSQHGLQFDEAVTFPSPLVYQDPQRSFFVKPRWRTVLMGYNQTLQRLQYDFYPFYHPYTALFLRELKRSGLDGLLNRRIQIAPQTYYPGNNHRFVDYHPAAPAEAHPSAATDVVDFDNGGAYSTYNWEIFFHAPLMVATKLTQNQRFEEALRWFHFIFDPTNTDAIAAPQRFWVTRPFFEQNSDDYRRQRIENLLQDIGANLDQLRAWKNDPFKPHLIARYRPVAYQKTVVMKYIDNLIAWGDQLFRRDTIESINEATTLYLLAWEILGPRPISVPNVARADRSYNELTADGALDPFGNQKVEILMENLTDSPVQVIRTNDGAEPLPVLEVSYFGIPQNDELLGYWDIVADRLFKIRHCMNIRGIVRQLPLFEPPIDPALLVQAAAAGVDLDTVLSGLGAPSEPVPVTRADPEGRRVRPGGASPRRPPARRAVEKMDASELELLRASNETQLLEATLDVKQLQVTEAQHNQVALERSQETAQGQGRLLREPRVHQRVGGHRPRPERRVGAGPDGHRPRLRPRRRAGVHPRLHHRRLRVRRLAGRRRRAARRRQVLQGRRVRGVDHRRRSPAPPTSGPAWRPPWAATSGARTSGSSRGLAGHDVEQLQAQIEAAKVRVAIAEAELTDHELQIEQARGIEDYLRTKYTNGQLYDWMLRQVSTVYFQSYQLAFDMAKRAEQVHALRAGRSRPRRSSSSATGTA